MVLIWISRAVRLLVTHNSCDRCAQSWMPTLGNITSLQLHLNVLILTITWDQRSSKLHLVLTKSTSNSTTTIAIQVGDISDIRFFFDPFEINNNSVTENLFFLSWEVRTKNSETCCTSKRLDSQKISLYSFFQSVPRMVRLCKYSCCGILFLLKM